MLTHGRYRGKMCHCCSRLFILRPHPLSSSLRPELDQQQEYLGTAAMAHQQDNQYTRRELEAAETLVSFGKKTVEAVRGVEVVFYQQAAARMPPDAPGTNTRHGHRHASATAPHAPALPQNAMNHQQMPPILRVPPINQAAHVWNGEGQVQRGNVNQAIHAVAPATPAFHPAYAVGQRQWYGEGQIYPDNIPRGIHAVAPRMAPAYPAHGRAQHPWNGEGQVRPGSHNQAMPALAPPIPPAARAQVPAEPQRQPGYRYSCYVCGHTCQLRAAAVVNHMVQKHNLQKHQVDRARIEASKVQMLW